ELQYARVGHLHAPVRQREPGRGTGGARAGSGGVLADARRPRVGGLHGLGQRGSGRAAGAAALGCGCRQRDPAAGRGSTSAAVRRGGRGGVRQLTLQSVRVAARISAKWIVRIGAPERCARPPMCIRQELSAATRYCAPVPTALASLSVPIATETSGFLIEKVPPNPQHSSAPGSSASSSPATARSSRTGRSPTFS